MNARNVQRCHVFIHILWKMKWKLNADGSKKKNDLNKSVPNNSFNQYFFLHARILISSVMLFIWNDSAWKAGSKRTIEHIELIVATSD